MAAYLIAQISIHDLDTFKKYQAEVPATIERHGGKYLVRGGEVADTSLLVDRDGLEPGAEPVRRPGLHLTEHEDPLVAQNEVEFATTVTPVGGDHPVAASAVPLRDASLTRPAEGLASAGHSARGG